MVDCLTLIVGDDILTLYNLLLRWQRCNILLDERTDCSLVIVTHDSECECCCIGCLLLGNLQYAVVVDVLQVGQLKVAVIKVVCCQSGCN